MTERLLARAILGPRIGPNLGGLEEVPEPYRTTVKQSRALLKLMAEKKGSLSGEPSEVASLLPITENPT